MTKKILTQARLKELLNYDKESGIFTWNIDRGRANRGDIAGTDNLCSKKMYRSIKIDYIQYMSHRLAWLFVTGRFPEYEIDHIDGNGTNNKFSNLRSVDSYENHKNMRIPSDNKSGVIGIYLYKRTNKWIAQIRNNMETINLGTFSNKADAIIARKMAEYKYGYFKNHGDNRPL